MNRKSLLLVLLLAFAVEGEDKPADLKANEGFVPLFNGKDLAGWEGDRNLWSVENGEIVGKSPGLKYNDFLASTDSYGDFVLKFKFKLVNTSGQANSGMQFRSQRVPESHEMRGYQADVGQGYWGCIYDESRRNKVLAQAAKETIEKAVKRDDWNEYTISCDGAHIVLQINGVTTADFTEPDPPEKAAREGRFGLQIHSGGPMEIRVKDMLIKRLEKK